MRPASIVFIAALSGCTWISKDDVAAREPQLDNDGDGHGSVLASDIVHSCVAPEGALTTGTDCNDSNANVYPGATEICDDGTDNDCDPATPADPGCD